MVNFDFFNGKRILITGGSGVLGFNLSKKIKELAPECNIHLNYLNYVDGNFDELAVFNHHRYDISKEYYLDKLPNFDVIFHCSGYGQPKKFTNNPETTFTLNTSTTKALLGKVKDWGKFVFISSSEVYSESNGNSEDSQITINPANTRNCYVLGKLFGESILSLSSRKVDMKSIRLCLCYGPGFRPDDKRVLSELIIQSVDKKKIELMDDGAAIRSYIYVDDCIDGILNICLNGKEKLYNIGGKDLITIKELAQKISKTTNSPLILGKSNNQLKNSPLKASVDISRYESEFGALNKIGIDEGLAQCFDWYKNYK